MGKIGQQLLLQLILILLNAFFAATEIAVISLNDNKIRKMADSGDARAKLMLRMVEEPNGFLSTIQIGITLAGFLGSAFAADTFSDMLVKWLVNSCGVSVSESMLNAAAVVVITIILSYFTLVLGELVPKRVAMRNPEKYARSVCKIITGLSVFLKPLVWLLSKSTNTVLRIMGINPNEFGENVTEEDILVMIDAAEEKGGIDAEAKEMIENVFDFDDVSVSDIMVHRPDMTVIWSDDSTDKILKTIIESGYSRIPVCGEKMDEVIGILRTREYLLALRNNSNVNVKKVMQDVFFVPDTIRANKLLQEMKINKSHMAIVVDEYGGTAGLITMEDLLEEIVGNIYDETDKEEDPEFVQLSDKKWKISGNVLLEDLEEKLGVSFPTKDEDYSTFGGFIIGNLSYIPQDGDTPEFDFNESYRIKIGKMSDKRVEWATIEKISHEEISKDN